MILKGLVNSKSHLFLRDRMKHNKFDYDFDMVRPLAYFFFHHNICFTQKNEQILQINKYVNKIKRKHGYIDERDNLSHYNKGLERFRNLSKYYNNF
jgi:hypothetical protein